MTDKEQQMLQWVDEIRVEVYEAIKHLSTALRKLAALAVLTLAKPRTEEYETPERPKIDTAALDIIREPIADEVPMQVEEEKPIPKKKRVRVDDFDTPLPEKEEGTSRDDKILYYHKSGKTLAWIAEKVGCSPQTVANVVNRHKQKEVARLNSEASYTTPKGGKS